MKRCIGYTPYIPFPQFRKAYSVYIPLNSGEKENALLPPVSLDLKVGIPSEQHKRR